jgi:hypothetical protein
VGSVAPIQLTTRLLVPEGSQMLRLPEFAPFVSRFDSQKLVYPWTHPNPAIDKLQKIFAAVVAEDARTGATRQETFDRLWSLAGGTSPLRVRTECASEVPQFLEPWFCCSEPAGELIADFARQQNDSN